MCAVVTVILGLCNSLSVTVVVICSHDLFKSSVNLVTNLNLISSHHVIIYLHPHFSQSNSTVQGPLKRSTPPPQIHDKE
jgi:hypothetical protein